MMQRLLLFWAVAGLAALTATALGSNTPAGPQPSAGPAPLRALPVDVSDVGLVAGAQVPVRTLLEAIKRDIAPLRSDPRVTAQLTALLGEPPSEAALHEYVAVQTAFEATRSGGWWHVRWDITDQEPSSSLVWDAWSRWPGGPATGRSVVAECDEISALFSVVARQLGADRVGLLWPTANHTVAVWTPPGGPRLVVPTTPIFLDPGERLGTTQMDPDAQRTIYTYSHTDGALQASLPGELARFFHRQVRRYMAASPAVNQQLRDLREAAYAGHWTLARVHSAADDLAARAEGEDDRRAIERFRVEYARD